MTKRSGGSHPPRLLLVYWGRRGGGAQYLLGLARELVERAKFPLYVSLSRQSELFEETSKAGPICLPLDTYSGPVSAAARSLLLPGLRRRLRAEMAQHGIDISIVCMSHPWGWAVADVLRAEGRRLITVVHDAAPHPGERYPLPSWIIGREIALSDGIVTLSNHVNRSVRSRYHTPAERMFEARLPSLIGPTTDGRVRDIEPRSRPVRLLFLGRILPYKGLDLLLDAMDLLGTAHSVTLDIRGAGIGADLAARAAATPGVRLEDGWIDETEMPRILDAADLLVAPYREASQSGVVPAALAAGIPVVATPVGGLVEQVAHGRTGLMTTAVSGAAIAQAITAFVDDPSLYRRCSEGALATSQTCLTWSAHAEEIEKAVDIVMRFPRKP